MIQFSKDSGHYVAMCDSCFDLIDFPTLTANTRDNFNDAKAEIELIGWSVRKFKERWRNVCNDCQAGKR